MKVLYLTNSIKFFLSHRKSFAYEAMRQGFDVIIVGALDCPKSQLPNDIQFQFLSIKRGWGHPLSEMMLLKNIFQAYRFHQPDIVHHLTIKPMVYGTLIAKILKVPSVINAVTGMGNLMLSPLKRKLAKCLYRIGCRHPNQQFIFQNETDLEIVKKWLALSQNQIHLIKGSGIDLKEYVFKLNNTHSMVIGLPSRMVWSKGIKEFVEAAKRVRKVHAHVRFVLIGGIDNATDSIPEERIRSWVSDGFVEWWGFCDDMQKVYRKLDVVCLPSYREGLPRCLLEAMALGIPVMTTTAPGCKETVEHMKSGYLFPERSVEGLSKAVEYLINHPVERKDMAVNARKRVEDLFSLDEVLQKTFKAYQYGCLSYRKSVE